MGLRLHLLACSRQGGFTLETNSIHTANVAITSNATNSVGLSSSTFTRTIGGTSRSNLKFAIGSNFGVANDGTIYASAANITGGSFQIDTAADSTDYIRLRGNNSTATLSNNQLFTYTNDYSTFPYGQWSTQCATGGITIRNYNDTIMIFGMTMPSDNNPSPRVTLMNKSGLNNVKPGLSLSTSYSGGATIAMSPKGSETGGAAINLNSGTREITLRNTSNTQTVSIKGTGNITCVSLTQTSDENAKNNIIELDKQKSSDFIYSLKPVSFKYNDVQDGSHHGITTQDVKRQIYNIYGDSDWAVVNEPNGDNFENDQQLYQSLAYTELIADLIATVQSQNERIAELEAKI